MARSPTDPGIGLSHEDERHCPRCLVELTTCRRDIEAEQNYGIDQAAKINGLQEQLEELRRQRAKSEGRDEIRDKQARLWGKAAMAIATGGVAPWVVKLIQHLGGGQ